MRRHIAALASLLVLAGPVAVQAADPPAVDLLAAFMLGARDGVTLSFNNGGIIVVLKQTAPGIFDGTPGDAAVIELGVHDKGGCLFDITLGQGGQVANTIRLDASKLKDIQIVPEGASDEPWTNYIVTFTGPDGLLQLVAADGSLSPSTTSSEIGTSLSLADMRAAAATFQSADCKPPA